MSDENPNPAAETAAAATPESTGSETESSTESKGDSNLNDLTDGGKDGDDAWFGDGDNKSNSNSDTEEDKDKSSESSSESETETETETASVSDVSDVKKLITDGTPIPEGTDENLVKAARAELLLEESQAETAKLRSYLNQNPAELFTEEQKTELKEILDTKGEDAWYERRKQLEAEVVEKRLNNPEFKEKSQAVLNQEAYNKFLVDNKINHQNFVNARLQVDVDAFNKKEITLDEFLKRTKASHDRMTKNIHKGDTPAKVVRGSSSKTGTPQEKDVWFGD